MEARLRHCPTPAQNEAVAPLLAKFNASVELYPDTSLRLHYVLEAASDRTETLREPPPVSVPPLAVRPSALPAMSVQSCAAGKSGR